MKGHSFPKAGGFLFLFLLSVALILGCEKDKGTPTESEAGLAMITNLSASSDSVLVGDNTVIISAMVSTDGQPDSGEVVNFSVYPPYLGTFSASSDTSEDDGQVMTVFHSNDNGITGSASVIARTQDASDTITVHIVSSEGPPTGEGGLRIQVDPAVLPADGDTTSEVTVTVKNASGLPVEDGTIVRLAAGEKFEDVDGDGYYNKYIDKLIYDTNDDGIWNPIGDIPSTAATSSGVATATYTAGLRAGMVYIKATAGSPDDPVTDDAVILLIPTTGDSVASIALEPASPTIQVKGTGGIEFVQMTATCYDDNGNHVMEGFPVIFDILNGPGGGEAVNGSTDPCTVLTNSSGIAQVTVNSGTKAGTINLIAYFGNVISNSTRITVCAGPPKFISVGANPCNIRGLDVVNAEAEIVAVVVDSFGNYVPNGTSVYFTVSIGMITPNSETIEGIATATFHSAPQPADSADSGIVIIRAETAGGTVVGTDMMITSADPYYIFFANVPDSIAASPKFDRLIYAGIADENLNPVVGGFLIDLEAVYGSIGDGTTGDEDICAAHVANAVKSKYVSTSLEKDYLWSTPDNGVGARETLSAASGFAYAETYFYLTTEYSSEDKSSIISEAAIDYATLGDFSVEIKDVYGNPLGGHQVVVTNISNGSLFGPGTDITDPYGKANFYFISADYDTTLKSVNITVADTVDPRGGIRLSKKISLVHE